MSKVSLSAIKPSGQLTLGSLSAILQFKKEVEKTDKMYLFIADLHALTKYISPEELRENTTELIKTYLAMDILDHNVSIVKQSEIPAHSQLEWILTCNTVLGEFTKMPQYKNFLETNKGKATPTGMLIYPSLMNADILLYDVDEVPVGLDQLSHIDLCRDVAKKFNKVYGETFKLPTPKITEKGAKIMSLSNPLKKMSKSESDKGTIYLKDDIKVVRKKVMGALTDMFDRVHYDPENQPGVSNLITIYSMLTNKSLEAVEEMYIGQSYGAFKSDLADIVCDFIEKLQKSISEISQEKITSVLEKGRLEASVKATEKINEIYRKVGLI